MLRAMPFLGERFHLPPTRRPPPKFCKENQRVESTGNKEIQIRALLNRMAGLRQLVFANCLHAPVMGLPSPILTGMDMRTLSRPKLLWNTRVVSADGCRPGCCWKARADGYSMSSAQVEYSFMVISVDRRLLTITDAAGFIGGAK